MKYLLILLLSFNLYATTCKEPQVENESKEPYNKHDLGILEHAKTKCKDKYVNSPCLKIFIKKEKYHTYWCICGAADEI